MAEASKLDEDGNGQRLFLTFQEIEGGAINSIYEQTIENDCLFRDDLVEQFKDFLRLAGYVFPGDLIDHDTDTGGN
jgi:hypothetical protein